MALLAALNVKGTQESSRLNLILAIGDLCTQIVLVGIGIALVLSPDILVNNVHLGIAPTWGDFALGIAVGMIAYTGIETISNMAEEARDAPRMIPRGVGLTVLAVLGLYVLIPIVALSAMPVTQNAAGHYTTVLGTKFAGDPVLGIVENLGLGAGLTHALRLLRRDPRRGDPDHRDQRGPDRGLPPDLLDGTAPSAPGRDCGRSIRGSTRRTWRSSPSPAWRRSRSSRARPTSWRRCTRSGPCCRSRSRTSR